MASGRQVRRQVRLSRPRRSIVAPIRKSFLTTAAYVTTATTTAGGSSTGQFKPSDFGLSAGTYVLALPQLVTGAGIGSTYRLRVRRMVMRYLPYQGRSTSLGAGCGWAAVTRSQNGPALIFNNLDTAKGAKAILAGKPFSLSWAPRELPDTLWVTSSVAQTHMLPADDTSVGCSMSFAMDHCAASTTIGNLYFVFTLEVEMY